MRLLTTCSAVLTLAFGIAADANAVPILWASTGNTNAAGGGRVYTIDPISQTVTLVGDSGLPKLAAMDFDNDGNLYGVTGGSGFLSDSNFLLNLYTFNTSNASPTLIGKVALAEPALPGNMIFNLQGIDAIAFDSFGTLFAGGFSDDLDMGRMLILDLTDASAILTAPTVADSFTSGESGLAFDAAGQLFGSRGNSFLRSEDLLRIDTMTEERISIGSATDVISDIWFAADDTLYGGSPNGDLFTIDSITGAKTFLFNTGIRISGLTGQNATVEVPEPTTLSLLGAGLIGMGWMRRRKRAT